MKATAKDLRFHLKELLDTVGRGEEVLITCRGKPCAKLVSIEKTGETDLFAIWKDNDETANVGTYVEKLRKGRF